MNETVPKWMMKHTFDSSADVTKGQGFQLIEQELRSRGFDSREDGWYRLDELVTTHQALKEILILHGNDEDAATQFLGLLPKGLSAVDRLGHIEEKTT